MKQYLRFAFVMAVVAAFAIAGSAAPPQADMGRVVGNVKTEDGKGVAGARISAVSVAHGTTRKTTTSKSGSFSLMSLKPGVYEVTVEADNMDRAMLQVRVTVGSSARLDFTLYPSQKEAPGGSEEGTKP